MKNMEHNKSRVDLDARKCLASVADVATKQEGWVLLR